MKKQSRTYIDVEIDKLTNSIENAVSGDVFDTEVVPVASSDIKNIKKADWFFDWHKEIKLKDRICYKLVIKDNPAIIQGLVSLSSINDHIYMHHIESAQFNKGKNKIYAGVPGNLIAFACKLSVEMGYDGVVAFDSKTNLINHYKETLYATHFKGTKMFIEPHAALRLINQYFKK